MPTTQEVLSRHTADIVGLSVYLVLTIGYYILLTVRLKARPEALLQGRMSWYRRRWFRVIFERRDGLLAVQTLRNQMMSASFLASTAILVDLGLLTLLSMPRESASFLIGDPGDPVADFWLTVKVIMLIGLYSFNFLCFAMCIRDLNYLSYLAGLYGVERELEEGLLDYLGDVQHKLGTNYTRGLRGYYFGLPLFFWLLSPYLLIVTTVIVLSILYVRDHSGRGLAKFKAE